MICCYFKMKFSLYINPNRIGKFRRGLTSLLRKWEFRYDASVESSVTSAASSRALTVLAFRHEHARRPLSRVVLTEAEDYGHKINNPGMVTATDSSALRAAAVIRSTEPDSI